MKHRFVARKASSQRPGAGAMLAVAIAASVVAGCSASSPTSPADAELAPAAASPSGPAAVPTRAGAAPTSAASANDEPPSPLGHDWIFVKVDGYDGPLPSPPPAAGFIMTREGQRLTGTTACNRMGSGFELDVHTGSLRFTSLRNTRMLCDRVASDTEEAVLAAMIATDSYRLDGTRLELLSKGRVVAILTTND